MSGGWVGPEPSGGPHQRLSLSPRVWVRARRRSGETFQETGLSYPSHRVADESVSGAEAERATEQEAGGVGEELPGRELCGKRLAASDLAALGRWPRAASHTACVHCTPREQGGIPPKVHPQHPKMGLTFLEQGRGEG